MSDEFVTGTPAGGDTPAPDATPAPVASPAPQPASVAAPQAPASGAPQPEPSWIKQRLDETRAATERRLQVEFQRKEAEYRSQLAQIQNQVRALVGVAPPQNPEIDNVRQQFGQVYPGLSRIEDRAEEILGILERAGDLESQNQHYWQSYGRQTMDRLFTTASQSLGSPLTEEGKRQLHQSFVGYVQQSPETMERYASDPSIVEDFWRAFTSSFIDPVRRVSAAAVTNRVPGALPQDSPSGAPQMTPVPKLEGLDERAGSAWALYQQNRK